MAISWNTVTWYSKALAVVLFVGVAVGAFYLGREYERVMDVLADAKVAQTSDREGSLGASEQERDVLVQRAKNASYEIDGKSFQLVNGVSRVAQEGASAEVVTQYFGNMAVGDVNKDGKDDAVFVMTQSTGGTGTFFYAAALVSQGEKHKGTSAVFMGDRIAPQSTDIRDGVANVNYADRAPNEPMITQPSIGKTLRLVIKDGRLVKQ